MKTVFEIIHHSEAHGSIKVIDRLPVRIGRAYDNDIVLKDVYISPYHAVVDYDAAQDALVITDLGSDNGIERRGDKYVLGQTEIKFFDAATPVPETQKLIRQHPVLARLSLPWVVWLVFILTIGISIGLTYMEVWSEEAGSALALAGMTVASIILLWAAAWSLIGRVTRHRAMFLGHVLVGSLYVVASSLLMLLQNYINFLSNENLAARVMEHVITILTMAPLMYLSLTLATVLRKRQRVVASLIFAGGIVGGTLLFGIVGQKSFDDAPHYPPTLEPYLARFAPADTPESFSLENTKIFDDKIFNKNK